jgi:hypothetical protein
MAEPDQDSLSAEEAARRRDEVIRRMIATPPEAKTSPRKTANPKSSPETNRDA